MCRDKRQRGNEGNEGNDGNDDLLKAVTPIFKKERLTDRLNNSKRPLPPLPLLPLLPEAAQ